MTSVEQRIEELAKLGNAPAVIAPLMGVSKDQVYYVLKKARQAGRNIPHFKSGGTVRTDPASRPLAPENHIVVPLRLFNLLKRQAERRNKTVSEFAQQVLEREALKGWARNG